MAGITLITKRTAMRIILAVTGGAVHRRAFELQINMTVAAENIGVLTSQFEDGIVVIKAAGLPAIGGMAAITLITKRAAVRIIFAVTGGAIHGRAFEHATDMAVFTSYGGM
jgi:hypothetical protein